MIPQEIFISHSSLDGEFVNTLVHALRRHGLPAWHSRTDILGAQQWHDEIGSALQRCDWFALVLSPNSVESLWVKRELIFALQQNRFADKIVPILYRPCDFERLSWVLPSFQFVDFSGPFEQGFHGLLRLWGMRYPDGE